MQNMNTILLMLFCYLLGAIPFGLLAGLWLRGVDIREHGSKNLGATNATRVLGKKIGLSVFALDFLKGFLPVWAFGFFPAIFWFAADGGINRDVLMFCALAAILGHVFPVYLKFKGGKGVATSLGALIAVFPLPAFCALGVFVVVVAFSKMISLGSVIAALCLPAFVWFVSARENGRPDISFILLIALSLLVIVKHKGNINRILNGTESKIGAGNKPKENHG